MTDKNKSLKKQKESPVPSPSNHDSSSHSSDERTWATLAHACTLLNSATAMGGLIAAGVIWLTQKEKSAWVAFHALQSLVFQGIQVGFVLLLGVLWILGFAFSFLTVGLGTIIAVPVLIIATFLAIGLFFVGLGYSLYGAYQIYNGQEFRYIWIGDWIYQNSLGKEEA